MHKRLAIANSICLCRKDRRYIKSVIDKVQNHLGADVIFTEYAGHAAKIARGSSGYEFIIALGGDGTISEIINGMDLDSQLLAVIPLGTGNSLARDLRIISPLQGLEAIKMCKLTRIDLIDCQFKIRGKIFKRYGVATSGIGYIADTVIFANRYLKSAGQFCYLLSSCSKLFSLRPISANIRIDDSFASKTIFSVFIINNTSHAANLCLFPRAKIDDSQLDLFYAKTNILTQSLANLDVLMKIYFYKPGVLKTAHKVDIILDEPSSLMLDGDIYNPVDEVRYSVMPHALKILN